MEFLKTNENGSFQTNILNMELIRTGTIKNGSCFFYSLFYPFQYFRKMSELKKNEFIKEKRKELADKIDLDGWFSLQNGNIAFIQITQTLNKIIHSIPSFLYNHKESLSCNDVVCLEILFTLLNPSTIEKEILPVWDIQCSQINMSGSCMLEVIKQEWNEIYKKKITEKINEIEKNLSKEVDKMSEEKKNATIIKLANISNTIFDFVANYTLNEFKNEIEDVSKWINVFTLYSIVHAMDVKMNILLIDSETGTIYDGMKLFYKKEMFNNDYPYVLILYFKQMHFECLGRKYINNDKTCINRLFKKDDPIIIACLSYLDCEY
jgi:hypothetical protein